MCVRACMREDVHACVRNVFVIYIYDHNIWPMLIIQIISLYFIQITHTDDFPYRGTRLVYIYIYYIY